MNDAGNRGAQNRIDGTALAIASSPAPQLSAGARIAFVDNARAIGIVLVVVGHAPALAPVIGKFIFAFHMPLFFFLSGLMVGSDRLHMQTTRRVALLARTLLVPYLFYFSLSYLYWLVAKRHGLQAFEFAGLSWWQPILGILHGSADDYYIDPVLWFFPCLFVAATAHHVARKALSAAVVSAVSLCGAFAFVLLHDPTAQRWPWSTDCAVVGIAFFAAGSALNARLRRSSLPIGRPALALLAVVALVACLALSSVIGHVDLNYLAFGAVPVLYLPTGAVGVLGVVALSALLPATRLGRWLSINTLVIFPLHFLFFSLVTGFAVVVVGLQPSFKDASSIVTLLYAGTALLLSWPAAKVLHALFPWVVRQPRSGRRPGPSGSSSVVVQR